jgi:hypothetical protein
LGQEFFINSQTLENKVRQLLPSQGGGGAGFDLSASTQIIPVVDLTESAEGSNLRQDLQSSYSHDNITHAFVNNNTTSILTSTGYWRLFGTSTIAGSASSIGNRILLNDGASDKTAFQHSLIGSTTNGSQVATFDFIVFLSAGDSITAEASALTALSVTMRQLADIQGVLISPT